MHRRCWIASGYHDDPPLRRLLGDPDAALAAPGAEIMKDDRAATVARIAEGGARFVVKRYRPNRWYKWLSRAVRMSKAEHSRWSAAQLKAVGVPVAEPVALVEDRLGFLRIRVWLVLLVVPGARLYVPLRDEDTDNAIKRHLLAQLVADISKAHQAGLVYGDTKAGNFVLNGDKAVFVDLDAVGRPWPQWRLRRAKIKDWRVLIETLKAGAEVEAMVLEELERRLSADEMRLLKRRLG